MRTSSRALRFSLLFILALFVFSLVVFAPFARGVRSVISQSTGWALSPFRVMGNFFGSGWGKLEDHTKLYNELASLRSERETLLIDHAAFFLLQKENENLRGALALQSTTGRKTTSVEVIGGFAEGRDEYLIIRVPRDVEVHEGAVAVSSQGVLVGFVRSATDSAATIRLASSASETVTVTLLHAGVDAVMRGDNNGEYIVSLVPGETTVTEGDVVVTAGRNPELPAGTPIGSVVSVTKLPSEVYYEVRVKSPVPVATISNVALFLE